MRKVVCLMVLACLVIFSCTEEKKVGKLELSNVNYVLEHDPKKVTVSLDVTGIVQNVSSYDIKKIVITGRSKSCSEVMVLGNWFVTQQEKRQDQYDMIGYLLPGEKKKFSFKGIAYFFKATPDEEPKEYPSDLEVYIDSFETVQ